MTPMSGRGRMGGLTDVQLIADYLLTNPPAGAILEELEAR
jgi:hypothetical protein